MALTRDICSILPRQVNSDMVEFALADQGSPSLVRAPGDDASLFVLMPMRV